MRKLRTRRKSCVSLTRHHEATGSYWTASGPGLTRHVISEGKSQEEAQGGYRALVQQQLIDHRNTLRGSYPTPE
jgi:hypothetical protein